MTQRQLFCADLFEHTINHKITKPQKHSDLPAGKVNLVSPQVEIGVRKDSSHFLKELAYELVAEGGRWVDWSKLTRWGAPTVTRCQQIGLPCNGKEEEERQFA